MNHENKIIVLLVEPLKEPKSIAIERNLSSMQAIVGGRIQEIMPFGDEVALICNEEGKNSRLPLNRAIKDKDSNIIDIIAGNFFICSAPFDSEHYENLSPELLQKYFEQFKSPQVFSRVNGEIIAREVPVKNSVQER